MRIDRNEKIISNNAPQKNIDVIIIKVDVKNIIMM